MARRQAIAELCAGLLAWLAVAAAAVSMLARALAGAIGFGDLAMYGQALQQGLQLARAALRDGSELYRGTLFLGNLFEFLDLEPVVVSPTIPHAAPRSPAPAIRLAGVRFQYPDRDRPILDGLDVEIPAGRITAIVGPNGAGKSTLLKLLCRFYDPTDGSICFDGIDLRNFDLDALRRRVTAVFQAPLHFNASLGDNIAAGDLTQADDPEALRAAARAAGAAALAAGLPQGYATLLGHWFEKGTELSQGEWQRVALARALLRPAPLLLLDEPGTGLDPWGEAEWRRDLRRWSVGRTVVAVTHRLSTALQADYICVLQAGRLYASGTHAELCRRCDLYEDWCAGQEPALAARP